MRLASSSAPTPESPPTKAVSPTIANLRFPGNNSSLRLAPPKDGVRSPGPMVVCDSCVAANSSPGSSSAPDAPSRGETFVW